MPNKATMFHNRHERKEEMRTDPNLEENLGGAAIEPDQHPISASTPVQPQPADTYANTPQVGTTNSPTAVASASENQADGAHAEHPMTGGERHAAHPDGAYASQPHHTDTHPAHAGEYPQGSAGAGVFHQSVPVTTPISPSVPPTPPPTSTGTFPTPAHAPQPEKKSRGGFIALLVVLICIVVVLGAWVLSSLFGNIIPSMQDKIGSGDDTSVTGVITDDTDFSHFDNQDMDKNLANAVAEASMPSIVSIYTYATPQQASEYDDLLSLLMGQGYYAQSSKDAAIESEPIMSGLGSGVIIREDGYIVTNAHVVDGADKIMVAVGDEEYDGVIVGQDTESDLAVVKIEASELKAIQVADSDKARVGDWVMAIGSPLGYEQTATTGIISALGRSTAADNDGTLTVYADLLQTDAAINSGNSGGALLDDEGKLLGINTLIASASTTINTGSVGIGFAIPSNYAIAVANQIIDDGKVQHAKLGVLLSGAADVAGALVAEIPDANSAAGKAGIQQGDIIVSFNGDDISDPTELVYAVRAAQPGDTVSVTFLRDGKEQTVDVVLDGEDVDTAVTSGAGAANANNGANSSDNKGTDASNNGSDSSNGRSTDTPKNIHDLMEKLQKQK